jgi:hypothetical protein
MGKNTKKYVNKEKDCQWFFNRKPPIVAPKMEQETNKMSADKYRMSEGIKKRLTNSTEGYKKITNKNK